MRNRQTGLRFTGETNSPDGELRDGRFNAVWTAFRATPLRPAHTW
jgi:hypothetical protein